MLKYFFIIFLLLIAGYLSVNSLQSLKGILAPLNPKVNEEIIQDDKLFQPPSISLEQIFSQDHTLGENVPAGQLRVLIATGDVILARSVNYRTVSSGNFLWPFEKVADVLKDGDVTFVNLETPLVANCRPTQEGMTFCGDIRNVEGLKYAGVDVVSLANNHAGNYGPTGVEETRGLLQKKGILVTGMSGPAFYDIRGLKFAFLGYNDIGSKEEGISWALEDRIQKEIKEAKTQAGVVVVTFHFGTEYVSQPTTRQRALARLAIDAGADLIIGNHPHWIQALELYKDKLIVYAHGNFIFDQMWSEKTREGVVGRYTFYKDKLLDVEFLPVKIVDYGQPYFLNGEPKKAILEEMRQESLNFAGKVSTK